MKQLLVGLALVCFLGTLVLAGMAEMTGAYKSGDYTATIAEANKVIADAQASVSDKATAQCYVGYSYFGLKQYDKAIPAFQKVISDYPGAKNQCATAQRYIASCYYTQRQYGKAVPEYLKVISDYPKQSFDCAAALLGIGNCYSTQKRYDEAIVAWQKAVDDYAATPLLAARAQRSIAHCYYAQKQYDKAVPEFQKVIGNYPQPYNQTYRAEAQLYTGNCYHEQEQGEKAQEAYLKVLSDYPAEVSSVGAAFKRVDFALVPDNEAVKVLGKMLPSIPATEANAALRKAIKEELAKRSGKSGAGAYHFDPDVRGYWLFDEEPKAGVPDMSGQGNNGVVHGPVQQVEGRHGGAYRFNGADTWVEIPFSPTLKPTKGMVIEMWLRPETVAGRQTVISRYEEETNRRSFRLSIEDGRVVLDYSGNGSGEYLGKGVGLRSEQRLVAGQWNHVVLSYGERFFSFLINGRTDPAFVGMHNPYHPQVPDLFQAEAPLQIGRAFDGRGGKNYYRGDMDLVRITLPEFPPAPARSAWEETPLAENALNNLVRRLLDKDAPKAGAYEFANPAEGWVFFAVTGLTGDGEQARLRIGGLPGEIVLEAKNRWEAMRRLPASRFHVDLALTGGRIPARLTVRRIPQLLYVKYVGDPDWEYLKRHVLHSVNMCVSRAEILSRIRRLGDPLPMVPRPPAGHEPIPEVKEWVGTGREWIVSRTSLRSPWFGLTYLDSYRKWHPSYEDPYNGMIVDEIAENMDYELLEHWTGVINQLKREYPNKRTIIWVPGFEMSPTNNIFFSVLLANGGEVAYERYISTARTEGEAWKSIDRMFVDPMRQLQWTFPGVQRQTLWCPSFWLTSNANDDVCPDVDYKVFLDMQFHTLATHPVFRDLAGIVPYGFDMADREIIRWGGALFRHYGIEGRKDRLSERYGYTYKLNHLENHGFEKGMQGLKVEAAEQGSVGIGQVKDKPELRPATYCVGAEGEQYLWMQRSARTPNRVRQQVRNLRPGKAYSFKLYSADLGDPAAVIKTPHALSIHIQGGKIIEKECDRRVVPSTSAVGGKRLYISRFFTAFHAEGETAELEISDWADEKVPGGPVGQRLYLDFNQVKPLFMGVDG